MNDTGINQLFGPAGDVGRWHRATVRRVRAEIVKRAPVDTGRLRSSWLVKHWGITSGNRLVSTIYTDVNYANYVIMGTGIYAGKGWITPKSKQFLRFRGRGGAWVFARRVRGQRPNNFVQDGLMAGAGATHKIRLAVPRR